MPEKCACMWGSGGSPARVGGPDLLATPPPMGQLSSCPLKPPWGCDPVYIRLMKTNNLLESITKMLGEVNGYPASVYEWVYDPECMGNFTEAQLAEAQGNWMTNFPEAWAKHGIYVL